jgi:hypothetical protein
VGLLAPAPANAQLCSASYGSYDELEVFYGDEHSHTGNAYRFSRIDDPLADQTEGCTHSHKAPALAYQQARANGLDFHVISHHNVEIGNGATAGWVARIGRNWWMAATEAWTSRFEPLQDFAARNVQGFPLSSGGFTDSEIVYLADVADVETIPGQFLAFYGIEYTVAGPGAVQCSPGAPQCGGHKIAVCPGATDTVCANVGSAAPDLCDDEGDLYAWAARNGCTLAAGHPCGPASVTDLTPFDPDSARGGFDDGAVSGYELARHCIDDPVRGYTAALDLGHRVSPRYGSDTHNRPGTAWGDGSPPLSEGNPLTEHCHFLAAEPGMQERMGCWATGLTRPTILDTFRMHRCFWVGYSRREPEIRLSVADDAWTRLWPMGSEIEVSDGDVYLEVRATNDPLAVGPSESFGALEIIHGGAVVATTACQSGALCDWSHSFEADVDGYYYARIAAAGTGEYLLVTAPVWVGPPSGAAPGPDSDADGIPDYLDNCRCSANPGQGDAGGPRGPGSDGLGDACQCADASGDGLVNASDVTALQLCLNTAGPCRPLCDADQDGACTASDVTALEQALVGLALPSCLLP